MINRELEGGDIKKMKDTIFLLTTYLTIGPGSCGSVLGGIVGGTVRGGVVSTAVVVGRHGR